MSTKPVPNMNDEPAPAGSVVLISPTNEVLMLHRVRTASAFPSAHAFAGGKVSEEQDGRVPPPGDPRRHVDSRAYRLCAIRETFEESGVLLAKDRTGQLVDLPEATRKKMRVAVHKEEVKFVDWLKEIGAEPELDALIPFTRWITPPGFPKRFSVQMYLYLLPLDYRGALDPEHDGGLEHTQAELAPPTEWTARALRGDVIMYEPQAYILAVLGQFLTGPGDYAAQRAALSSWLWRMPTGKTDHYTAQIPWADKVFCPVHVGTTASGKEILAMEPAGPELEGQGRGGDHDRVVLVNDWVQSSRHIEVRMRDEVEAEERAAGAAPKSRV
ncbi:hypothetical protein CC85DRAFT_282693 [Cutaneotrichosporon oleaginosum]|uniref:Nudix hydrolase domain-containing protein n=1 Tax=Cutaneotrichosporon oleaginosum TaxID=879819 RepID=A0A0J0XVY8_9TREE|nr:uncharacterized protein CC85DRAFT_282693 [Cutaneotrichosporon oleaginosum]KLT45203.1 hypothetical protein CC85DRAFT_282693 [Cutaneotrichosporon oleaginosum]TXT14961.1 hypothetical protein COLE_01154 [Cutaneotrichosporon oleaginosum]